MICRTHAHDPRDLFFGGLYFASAVLNGHGLGCRGVSLVGGLANSLCGHVKRVHRHAAYTPEDGRHFWRVCSTFLLERDTQNSTRGERGSRTVPYWQEGPPAVGVPIKFVYLSTYLNMNKNSSNSLHLKKSSQKTAFFVWPAAVL